MAGMSCVCSPDNSLQATCSLPEHSGTELLLASMLVLAGILVWRLERCCVDADASSDSEEDNDEPPTSMFS
jgi:hypothetical protein|eukprot:COSAG06_NODE_3421_length_5370_cov_8.010245_5_plen_71_part_00